MINQISVFIENTTGRLADLTDVLSKNDIDMKAICVADTVDFGILRCIVDDAEKAVLVLKEAGFTASITKVLGVDLEDTPGGLNKVLETLSKAGIGVDYVYSTIRATDTNAVIIIKVDEPAKAQGLLADAGVKMVTQCAMA